MQPVATDGVVWSVCVLPTTVRLEKMAELIEMLFVCGLLGPRNHVLVRRVQILRGKGCFGGHTGACMDMQIS